MGVISATETVEPDTGISDDMVHRQTRASSEQNRVPVYQNERMREEGQTGGRNTRERFAAYKCGVWFVPRWRSGRRETCCKMGGINRLGSKLRH